MEPVKKPKYAKISKENFTAEWQLKKIHFMGLKCEPGQTNIWDCYRELALGCDHTQDVIIECVMIDYDKP